jgi:hypothetical protein
MYETLSEAPEPASKIPESQKIHYGAEEDRSAV